MPSERARLAIAMTLLMVLSPVSYAGVSNWSGPSMINSDGTPTVVDGFTVPTNATVMDGWVHVTNSPLPSSSDSGIVWDEFVGYWLTMAAVPFSWEAALWGFVVFRVFDILKPWPIRWADRRVAGGFGIMIDDVLAGIYAWSTIHLWLWLH